MTYHILTADRKEVKQKLEMLTGEKAVYAGTPSFAFKLDDITIGRDGTVEAGEEHADILQQLVDDGSLEKMTGLSDKGGNKDDMPETENRVQKLDAADNCPEAEEADMEIESQDAAGGAEPLKAEFTFPLSQHRPESLCNLIFTIYSKGDLLDKSTGGDFFVSDSLKDRLKGGKFNQNADVISVFKEAGTEDLRGLSFSDTTYSFTGFPETEDTEKISAWMRLSAAIHQAAIKQKRIQPKRCEETNEKFAFRTWLTRIGMNGPDLKAERQIYYQNLSGHTAFRTQADVDRWKKRQAEKRMELKAEPEADSSGSVFESDAKEETAAEA